jgi:hypothetical protein
VLVPGGTAGVCTVLIEITLACVVVL